MSRKTPKFEALVVNAIRRLQAAQGSTANEIASYLSQEYDVSGPEIKKQIQLTIRRGLNYGILQKSKRGYTTCDRNVSDMDPMDEDCYECRIRRRRGGERILSRRARSKKRGGYRALSKPTTRSAFGSGCKATRKRVKKAAKPGRRAAGGGGVTRKAPTGRRLATKPSTRRAGNLEKAKQQKKQATPDGEPPDNNSNASTSNSRSVSKSPVRKESETNQQES